MRLALGVPLNRKNFSHGQNDADAESKSLMMQTYHEKRFN